MTEPEPIVELGAAPRPLRVLSRKRETTDTFTLALDASDLGGFDFRPGQFNMLYAFGSGEVPISISGDAGRPERLVHTVRAVGPVTRSLERIKRGDFVGVRGPYGRGWPIDDHAGSDVVIVAGGIGLAPLRPILYSAFRKRARYGRLAVVYGARTPSELLFRDELARWADRRDLQLEVTVDRGDPDWAGHTGVVTKWIGRLNCRPEASVAFVCGPDIMMRFAARELSTWGMNHERIYVSGERNMKCAVGWCGRCQLGPYLLCRDGPVFSYSEFGTLMSIREL